MERKPIQMIWKEKTVIKILLLVAKMVADKEWKDDIQNLANHITSGIGQQ